MATEVRLPRKGSTTMASGVVLEWFVAVGDQVDEGQVLADVETDKVSIEIESPVSGTVLALHASVQDEVEVGGLLASIGAPTEKINSPHEDGRLAADHHPDTQPAATTRTVIAAPAARRRAAELGVALDSVEGTGPGGRITSADVEAAAAVTTKPASRSPLAGLAGHRRLVAERMTTAARETAAVTLTARADVTFLDELNPGSDGSLVDKILHKVIQVLVGHPDLNASLTSDGVVRHSRIGLGYAVDGPRGLIVPVVHDACDLDLNGLAAERRRLVAAAQRGQLGPDDLRGGTFTVTNLGPFGIGAFTPIITPGQSAILGMGAVEATYVPGSEGPQVRRRLVLSLTFDHRIVDGAPAARFLQELCRVLADESTAPAVRSGEVPKVQPC